MVGRPHPEVSLPGAAGEVLHHQVLRLHAHDVASHVSSHYAKSLMKECTTMSL